ncbi:hypothetical protein [Actinacidiphila yeochonensis]|uniref:hypothetical protein n=1 Tax=Actinacidiphila yeochonensis TaxID=89050 RepID=UPI000562000C|nr:hypothetical protein [Actinacidiphila yeochonensis]
MTTGGGQDWEFTDDRGRTLRGTGAPRVAAYLRAGAALREYGIRPVAVYGSGHDAADAPDPAKTGDLDLAEAVYLGGGAAVDAARLREVGADLVVDVTYDGKTSYALPEETARAAGVQLAALGVSGDSSLGEILGRFAALAGVLGAGPHPASGEQALAEEELRGAVAGGGAPRAVALSPAGPEQVHLARPGTWPELRRLAELGLPLPDPGPGPGVNWLTLDWDRAADAVAGARLVLADCRANAVPVAELADLPAWQRLTRDARVLPWNPELPPAPGASAAFIRSVTAALRAV